MTTRTQLIENYVKKTLNQTIFSWHKIKPTFVQVEVANFMLTIRESNFLIEWESDEYCLDWYETATRVIESIKPCFDETCNLKLVGQPIVKAVRSNHRQYDGVGKFIGEKQVWTFSIEGFIKGFENESYVL